VRPPFILALQPGYFVSPTGCPELIERENPTEPQEQGFGPFG